MWSLQTSKNHRVRLCQTPPPPCRNGPHLNVPIKSPLRTHTCVTQSVEPQTEWSQPCTSTMRPTLVPVHQWVDSTPDKRSPSGVPTKSPGPLLEYRRTDWTHTKTITTGHPEKESRSYTHVSSNRPDPRVSRQKVRTLYWRVTVSTGPLYRRLSPDIPTKSPGPMLECRSTEQTHVLTILTGYLEGIRSLHPRSVFKWLSLYNPRSHFNTMWNVKILGPSSHI